MCNVHENPWDTLSCIWLPAKTHWKLSLLWKLKSWSPVTPIPSTAPETPFHTWNDFEKNGIQSLLSIEVILGCTPSHSRDSLGGKNWTQTCFSQAFGRPLDVPAKRPGISHQNIASLIQKFRKGVGGQRGLAQGNSSHSTNSSHFSVLFFLCPLMRRRTLFWETFFLPYFGRCWSPTLSRQPLFETSDLCFEGHTELFGPRSGSLSVLWTCAIRQGNWGGQQSARNTNKLGHWLS